MLQILSFIFRTDNDGDTFLGFSLFFLFVKWKFNEHQEVVTRLDKERQKEKSDQDPFVRLRNNYYFP